MKRTLITLSVLLAISVNGIAQNYDPTGTVRLWAPSPPGGNLPVVVPGYGSLGEGAISNSFNLQTTGGCFPAWTYGVCVVKSGGGGYSLAGSDGRWHSLCPSNTYGIITGTQATTTGSVCGGD